MSERMITIEFIDDCLHDYLEGVDYKKCDPVIAGIAMNLYYSLKKKHERITIEIPEDIVWKTLKEKFMLLDNEALSDILVEAIQNIPPTNKVRNEIIQTWIV